MDWRHNQWVGVGAAILVVVGIVGTFYWLSKPTDVREHGGRTFLCEASNQTFKISDAALDKMDGIEYRKFFGNTEATECEFDSNNDAHWVYYCPTCEKYYNYTKVQANSASGTVICPKEHEIEGENQ